jgi:hypothetical protein
MANSKEASGLIDIVARIIDTRRDEDRISPSSVATEAMIALRASWMNKPNKGYPLVYVGCHLQCRQIARQLLRQQFEPEQDADKMEHPLFPGLQWRYPIARSKDEEPQYVLLELMTKKDWIFNLNRLEADAASRLHHADILRAWGASQFAKAPEPVA